MCELGVLSPFPFNTLIVNSVFIAILQPTVQVDVDENDETAKAEKIHALPTFKFYKNAKALSDILEEDNEASLRDKIKKHK